MLLWYTQILFFLPPLTPRLQIHELDFVTEKRTKEMLCVQFFSASFWHFWPFLNGNNMRTENCLTFFFCFGCWCFFVSSCLVLMFHQIAEKLFSFSLFTAVACCYFFLFDSQSYAKMGVERRRNSSSNINGQRTDNEFWWILLLTSRCTSSSRTSLVSYARVTSAQYCFPQKKNFFTDDFIRHKKFF